MSESIKVITVMNLIELAVLIGIGVLGAFHVEPANLRPFAPMGLGPLTAIYQARFNRYLEDRGLKTPAGRKVWCFMGDGESDEPESLGAISLAGREGLDNLIFVVNCNLQRLDGPVRGNGKIIQELEAAFRGAGWNVIKVIWGSDWDRLLDADQSGRLIERMEHSQGNFILPNDPALIWRAVEHVVWQVAGMKVCDATDRRCLGVALEEALLNAIHHGNLE